MSKYTYLLTVNFMVNFNKKLDDYISDSVSRMLELDQLFWLHDRHLPLSPRYRLGRLMIGLVDRLSCKSSVLDRVLCWGANFRMLKIYIEFTRKC